MFSHKEILLKIFLMEFYLETFCNFWHFVKKILQIYQTILTLNIFLYSKNFKHYINVFPFIINNHYFHINLFLISLSFLKIVYTSPLF